MHPLARGALLGGLFVCGSGREARATPGGRVALRWEAPQGCIDQVALAQAIEQTLGREVFAASDGGAEMRGRIEERPRGGYQASLSLVVGQNQIAHREISVARGCRKLDESVAVVAAIMLDNWLSAASPTPLSLPAPVALEPPPAVLAGEPAGPPSAAPGPAAPRLGVRSGLVVGATRELLPGVVPHVGLRGGVELPGAVGLEATFRGHGTSRAVVDGSGGEFSAWTGSLDACGGSVGPRFELRGCLGVGGGGLSAGPVGLVGNGALSRPLAFVQLTAPRAALRLAGPLWGSLELAGWIPLIRDPFVYRQAGGGSQVVHRLGWLIPVVSVGVELRSEP